MTKEKPENSEYSVLRLPKKRFDTHIVVYCDGEFIGWAEKCYGGFLLYDSNGNNIIGGSSGNITHAVNRIKHNNDMINASLEAAYSYKNILVWIDSDGHPGKPPGFWAIGRCVNREGIKKLVSEQYGDDNITEWTPLPPAPGRF